MDQYTIWSPQTFLQIYCWVCKGGLNYLIGLRSYQKLFPVDQDQQ